MTWSHHVSKQPMCFYHVNLEGPAGYVHICLLGCQTGCPCWQQLAPVAPHVSWRWACTCVSKCQGRCYCFPLTLCESFWNKFCDPSPAVPEGRPVVRAVLLTLWPLGFVSVVLGLEPRACICLCSTTEPYPQPSLPFASPTAVLLFCLCFLEWNLP